MQAASCCGLPQDAAAPGQPSNMLSKELPEASEQLIQLACSRLLSATCVKQQIQAIKDQQQDQSAVVAKAQPTASEVNRAAAFSQQGPQSLEESGTGETSTGPTAGSQERYSRDAALSDNEAAQDAEEDRQIADAAMARLLNRRYAWHHPACHCIKKLLTCTQQLPVYAFDSCMLFRLVCSDVKSQANLKPQHNVHVCVCHQAFGLLHAMWSDFGTRRHSWLENANQVHPV